MKLTKTIALMLAFCLLLTCLPMPAKAETTILASGSCGEASWMMESNGKLTIYGVGSMWSYNDGETQPWHSYKGLIKSVHIAYGITNIGQFAFSGCHAMESVSIPDSVTSIGIGAFFSCGKLTSVQLPSGISVIPANTFEGCHSLEEVILPDNLVTIGKNAFNSCYKLKSLTFPETLKYIDETAFSMCQGLEEVIFTGNAPSGVITPFYGVETTVYYPVFNATWNTDSMSAIAKDADITWVPLDQNGNPYKPGYAVVARGIQVYEQGWVLTDDGTLAVFDPGYLNYYVSYTNWQDYAPMITSAVIMDGVDRIWGNQFSMHANMTSVSIPDTVTAIDNYAFAFCDSLVSITLPAGIQKLANNIFSQSNALQYVYFEGDAPKMDPMLFQGNTLTCVYPAGNPTWTKNVMQDYGGHITWVSSDQAHLHEYHSVVTEPTCLDVGYTTHTCTICGYSYVDSYTDPAGHAWESTLEPPTCTAGGYTYYLCSRCGHSTFSDFTDPLGHDYVAETTSATCDRPGCTVYTCSRCGHSYEEIHAEPLGHDYETVVTPATCTEKGYTTYTCKTCGYAYETDYTNALRHNYTSERFEATCTEDGYILYTCSRCGHSYESVFMLAKGHYYESVITPPAVGQPGFTTHTCRRCGDSYREDFHDALYLVDVLSGDYSQWLDEGSLVFRIDANAADFTNINVDGFELYSEEYTVTGNPAVITLNPVFFSRMGEGEHTLQIFFGNGLATAHFTVTRTPEPPKEESYIDWSFENGTLTITGRGNMENYYEAPWNEYKDQIKHVVIEDGITSISSVFQSYPNLTTVSIPDSVQYIEDHAFYECASLTSIVIPEGVPEIGMGTFCGCTSLESIYIPDSVQTLGYYAFMSCSSLKEVRIPEGVTYLDEMLFWACSSLTTVHLPSTLNEIRSSAFSACYSITGINLPHGLTYIGSMVFSACSELSNVVIPSTVTYIGEQAFSACWSLNTITFKGNAPTFDGTRIFENSYATAYYPKDNPTWTASVRKSYGAGYLAWIAINPCEKGHSYRTEVTAPTCTEDGYTTYTCAECGDTYVDDVVTAPGHDYHTVTTEATCTQDGISVHTCRRCGNSYEDGFTPALGHDLYTEVHEPTFDSEGYTYHGCTRCDYEEITHRIPALVKYEILAGDNSVWNGESGEDLAFRANGDLDTFTHVRLNGQTVEPVWYTVTRGSTVITFTQEFLAQLHGGEYTLDIVFEDGYATASFTVENTSVLLGDADSNGRIDLADAYAILLSYNGQALAAPQLLNADVNGDGRTDAADAYRIILFYTERIHSLR